MLVIATFLLLPLITVAQWDDCPYGKTDGSCEFPGECRLYADHNNDKICDHSQNEPVINSTIRENINIKKDVLNNQEIVFDNKLTKQNKMKYPLLQVTIVITILYILTYILAKSKVIKMVTHKKIWNILLTISFLAMAALSVILIIQINSGRMFLPNFDALYWHVITGIVMMVITIFHMGWHWRYYKNILDFSGN